MGIRAPVRTLPPTPMPTELRRDGEILVFVREGTGPDLAAQDPETGEARKVVETDGIVDCPDYPGCTSFVKTAEWSSDGRWVAFEVSFDSLDLMPDGPCGPTAGLWVQGAIGEPRQLTTPCDAPKPGAPGSPSRSRSCGRGRPWELGWPTRVSTVRPMSCSSSILRMVVGHPSGRRRGA